MLKESSPGAGPIELVDLGDGQHRLSCSLRLDRPLEEVFQFFSSPHNLPLITPDWLALKVLDQAPLDMRSGLRIRYRFRVRGVPARWRSQITAWDPPHRFVDEQLAGPFSSWHHEHRFFEDGSGQTIAADEVTYRAPGGPLVHRLLVEPELLRLFTHRHARLRELLGPA